MHSLLLHKNRLRSRKAFRDWNRLQQGFTRHCKLVETQVSCSLQFVRWYLFEGDTDQYIFVREDMAATMERLQEYRTHNSQFCKRIHDFLTIMFTAQVN